MLNNSQQQQQQQQQQQSMNDSDVAFHYLVDTVYNIAQEKAKEQSYHPSLNDNNYLKLAQYNLTNYNSVTDVSPQKYKYVDIFVELVPQERGFGFHIIGGSEDSTQVSIGSLVPNGAADLDGRLRSNDEIIMIDNDNVVGVSHRNVVKLMANAALKNKVKLWVKRKIPVNDEIFPRSVIIVRNQNEVFGFVIARSISKRFSSSGDIVYLQPYSWIAKIVENSPAERCGQLKVGDHIIAVNNIDITSMEHADVVNLINSSKNVIKLTIGAPIVEVPPTIPNEIIQTPSYDVTIIPPHVQPITKPTTSYTDATAPIYIPAIMPNTNKKPTIDHSNINHANVIQQNTFNQNNQVLIQLQKSDSRNFGFCLRGGKEYNMPFYVLRLSNNGAAVIDGRLKAGDQILAINGKETYDMTQQEAVQLIKSGGNRLSLLVRRTGLPPPEINEAFIKGVIHFSVNKENKPVVRPLTSTLTKEPNVQIIKNKEPNVQVIRNETVRTRPLPNDNSISYNNTYKTNTTTEYIPNDKYLINNNKNRKQVVVRRTNQKSGICEIPKQMILKIDKELKLCCPKSSDNGRRRTKVKFNQNRSISEEDLISKAFDVDESVSYNPDYSRNSSFVHLNKPVNTTRTDLISGSQLMSNVPDKNNCFNIVEDRLNRKVEVICYHCESALKQNKINAYSRSGSNVNLKPNFNCPHHTPKRMNLAKTSNYMYHSTPALNQISNESYI